MKFIVLNIKSFSRNNPTVTCVSKKVLMKIAYAICIAFINLSKAFIFNSLLNCFSINF